MHGRSRRIGGQYGGRKKSNSGAIIDERGQGMKIRWY